MTNAVGSHALVSFVVDGETIHVRDELEGQDLRLTVPEEPTPEPALTDLFVFPVDDAITITTSEVRIEAHSNSCVRDENGNHLGEFTTTERQFPKGTYFLEVTSAVKTYVRLSDVAFSARYPHCDSLGRPLEISFNEPTQVAIGARSLHSRPQATIEVPDDPVAMMDAISYLGSSMKEFSCERSWPSLRGHPPAIERGTQLEIPSELTRPDTGVEIAVPATYGDVYRVSPLAFYLGGTVVAGDRPELRLENGYVEPLETRSESLESAVDRLLGTCFLLDSLTRVGGYYTRPRYEYDDIAQHLPFYPQNLYDESISDQLMEYLEVPLEVINPSLPRWPMTIVVQPRPEDVELLPYALNTLSRVHVAESERATLTADAVEAECSSKPNRPTGLGPDSRSESAVQSSLVTTYTDEPPVGASYATLDAFENALAHSVPAPGELRMTVVSTDGEHAENVATRIDAVHTGVPLDSDTISVVSEPTRDELRRTLTATTDFLYCDVPVSSDGFECVDGSLEVDRFDDVGMTGFSLHGPSSLEAGLELLARGAVAGIVTDEAIGERHATWFLRCILKAHTLAESAELAGVGKTTDYRFVGDATQMIVRRSGGLNTIRIDIESVSTDEHELAIWSQPTDVHQLGSISKVFDESVSDAFQLVGVTARQPLRCTTSEVVDFLEDDDYIVRLNGRTYHGEHEATETFVRESARRYRRDAQFGRERDLDVGLDGER